jgi:DNA-binding transcriptional ArsR family regulator
MSRPQVVALEQVFRALAEPTRLAVVQRLTAGPASVSELAAPFAMALPSFMQHLKVLEDADLVRSHKSGRVRTYSLHPAPLRQAEGWLSHQRSHWEARLDRLDAFLLTMKEEDDE